MKRILVERLIPIFFFAAAIAAPSSAPGGDSLEDGFAAPPAAAKPRTWWHWMNGNVSKAGITADLEAMAKAGLGGAHLFDVGCNIPPGDVKFNTPSWDEHVDWAAREAERLGLELTLVNCSGWANAGGPWITPSNSMFFVRHAETAVKGGTTFRGALPRPKDDHGFYRDVAVLAFPRPACEREPAGGFRVASPSPWVRVVSADEPFALGGFTFSATYGWGWNVTAKVRVETSDDGRAWRETEAFDMWLSSCGRSDCNGGQERYVAFTKPVRTRQVRITIAPEDKTFAYKTFRPESRRGLPDLNARTFRSHDVTAPCTHVFGADGVVDPARIVDLTDRLGADGTLDWTAPAGDDWVVLRVGYASNGASVAPASSFGGGLEVDKLDAAAVGLHFDSYAGRLAKGRKAVKSVLCDSWEVGTQNWTHGLEKTFARRKGYSFVPYLVAFSGRVVGSVKKTDEALLDFRRLVSDLFVENFVDECASKARAAGLRYAMEPYGSMSADSTHYAAHANLPMAEFWVTADDGVPSGYVGHSACAKGVSSAAHLHGRDVVDAEAFTAFPLKGGRWTKDPFGLKAMGDFYYAHGVTRMVYHRFAHQPWTEPARLPGMTMGQWGTHFERTETWWPMVGPWLEYQARCQFLLSAGHPANDLLVHVGDEVPNFNRPEAAPEGWSWDLCGMHDLEDLCVVNGRIVPKDAPGVSYAALVVPTNRLVTAASREHLDRLKAFGATILKSGEKPPFAPDFTYSGTDEQVRAICRRHDDGTLVWFVAWPSTNAATVRCSFRAVGTPELWDAETGGRFRPYDWKIAGGRTEVTLPFKPCGSWFVVVRPGKVRSSLPVLADPAKYAPRAVAKVDGPWELSFPKGWNCPDKVTLPKLVSWTEIPDGEVRYFSGIAAYSKTVALPKGFADGKSRVVLDLGRVKNVAEVTVNGKAFPPLWRPPFRVDVTDAVRAGEPVRLAVRVANLWPNRLVGDEQKPADCEWGYGWDALAIKEIPAWVKAGKPSPTGRLAFTTWHHWTKDDALLESGLIGPVSVRAMPAAADEAEDAEPVEDDVPALEASFSVDAAKPGAVLPNASGVMTVWDGNNVNWAAKNANAKRHPIRGFVDWVELMACTGGNASRDLFKNPGDPKDFTCDAFKLVTACREILSLGARPYLKLGNVPDRFAGGRDGGEFSINVYPPENWDAYAKYLRDVFAQLREAFGADEMRRWRYAVLTEADNFGWFKTKDGDAARTREAYFRLYDLTALALEREIGPGATIGPHLLFPGDSPAGRFKAQDVIAHCAAGTNYATGKIGAPLKLLTISHYVVPGDGTRRVGSFDAAYRQIVDAAEKAGFTNLVYGVDEGRVIFSAPGAKRRDLLSRAVGASYEAAYDVRVAKQTYDVGAEYFAHWGYFSGPAIHFEGVPTFSYFTAREIAKFRGMRRLPVAEKRLVDANNPVEYLLVAAADAKGGAVRAMAARFVNRLEEKGEGRVEVAFSNPAWKNRALTLSTLTLDDSANWFCDWCADRKKHGVEDSDFDWSPDDPAPLARAGLRKREHRELFARELQWKYAEKAGAIRPVETTLHADAEGRVVVPIVFTGNAAVFLSLR
ncbi:MAG: hypothetical protein MJ138_01510 [Kiritimatiellae bacterium]|nr:hypothetical protein [Kiritimatiellia bacterium]